MGRPEGLTRPQWGQRAKRAWGPLRLRLDESQSYCFPFRVTPSLARKPTPAPVPQSRLGRLARIGFSVAEFAAAGAIDGLRGLGRSDRSGAGSAMLSARNAQRLAGRLAKLRGAAMKLGQIVSLQGADVLPPEFVAGAGRAAFRRGAHARVPAAPCTGARVRPRLGVALCALRFRADRRRLDRAGAPRSCARWPRPRVEDPVSGRCSIDRERRGQRGRTAPPVQPAAARRRCRRSRQRGETPTRAGGRLSQGGAISRALQGTGRRRTGAPGPPGALGPDDKPGHGDGLRRTASRSRRCPSSTCPKAVGMPWGRCWNGSCSASSSSFA